jgi:hypothetical protein
MKMLFKRTVLAPGLAALLAATASAQSDSCGSATAISGLGSWSFNTSSATTDGSTTPCAGGQIHNDVWFAWTAPSTATFQIATCSGTSFDSKIAAYSSMSGCSGADYLTCNDDACGLQSTMVFAGTSGHTYLLRVGGYGSSDKGSGNLSVSALASGDPDVIVGDLMDMNYYGTSSGISAYSLGTYSCNIGTTELEWYASSNRHPVIGQNMYRFEDGRFEMVGMSWLKHGFTALQQNLCCTCISSGTGSRLGVGCSDPYTAGLNGSQSGLGPRFEVNAHTGVYPYPFTAQGSTGGTTYKRLQVNRDDINPSLHPNALYYGEGHYVTLDDAAAGNGNNNASWRPLVRQGASGGGWDMDVTSSTVREEPAIYAWLVNDPQVQLEELQVPGEGLFLVGSRATDNGDGTWHYEYAIFNLNSDRGAHHFQIDALPSIAPSTEIGFKDIDYHSGEPFDMTDWAVFAETDPMNDPFIRWESFTNFNTNPNGNAIRWGTLYNFRFDSTMPPEMGDASIGLYGPGGVGDPDSVSFSIQAPSAPGMGGCNAADNAEPFGVLDLADVQGFIAAFTGQGPAADIAAPFGVWDLADVQAFIAEFTAGCP